MSIHFTEKHGRKIKNNAYTITWYDTWSGKLLKSTMEKSQNGELVL